MKNFKVDELKDVIKSVLKKNKHTYSDLAEYLDCSEPTIKRVLGHEELSLSRLLQICDFLNLSLSDLEVFMKKEEPPPAELSERQQIFLVENKNYFAFLFELYQDLTPDQIASKYQLTPKSLQKYLINLEKQELIKVTSKNKVRPFYKSFPHLGKGPLGVAYYKAFIENASHFFIQHISDEINSKKITNPKQEAQSYKKGSKYAVHSITVREETFLKYITEVESKLHELNKISTFEEKTEDLENTKTGVIVFGHTVVEHENKNLNFLTKTFGEIKNL